MPLSYLLRLVCLFAVSMGLLQLAFELLLWIAAPAILRLQDSLRLRHRERALYLIQFLPLLLALLLTAGFFVPRYVSNETNFASERVGWLCLGLAAAVCVAWVVRLFGGIRMAVRTMLFGRACRRNSCGGPIFAGETPIIPVPGPTPRVALVGLLRPFIFISKSLIEEGGLDALALEVVLDHERAHAAQRDNWKLLSLVCLPRLGLRLPKGNTWMQLWQHAAEWAADEDAVRGNTARAILLAETLVALARSAGTTMPQLACTYFICPETELALRVERLIDRQPDRPAFVGYKAGLALGFLLIGAALFCANIGPVLGELPEHLLHLG